MGAHTKSLKILLLTHSFNGLSQRLFVDLRCTGHQLSVELDINDRMTQEAIDLFQPDLLLAPFLKRPIPESIWSQLPCLIIHPGPAGERGPASLDWAILHRENEWGVTLLQANEIMDGGPIWGEAPFPMRNASKGSHYRHEVAEAASQITLQALSSWIDGNLQPRSQKQLNTPIGERPWMQQQQRAIDWQQDSQETVLRKIYSADGSPGLLDSICGRAFYLYDAHPENHHSGAPGEIIGRHGPAICRATADGKGVWIGHLREKEGKFPFKLPATHLLSETVAKNPEIDSDYHEIKYREIDNIGLLHFNFYNGAMSAHRCQQLQQALQQAKARPTQAILLFGGEEYWSNGMDLNQIEAAESAADASWENINAMDDLALEIINTRQLTISALQGNAAAGGVFLARAADRVWARSGVILNPHYKDMGNLHGSEYWSYLLPRYCGESHARQIMQARLPMGTAEAMQLRLIDDHFSGTHEQFRQHCMDQVHNLIRQPDFSHTLEQKLQHRLADEAERPLSSYRDTELEQMKRNFYGFDPSYHIARYNFVHKVPKSRTPITLANHRQQGKP